jgi:hypothetical protein
MVQRRYGRVDGLGSERRRRDRCGRLNVKDEHYRLYLDVVPSHPAGYSPSGSKYPGSAVSRRFHREEIANK